MSDGRFDAAELREFVAQALAEWDAPGASVAVVSDGECVFAGGVGVRELGRPEPMDGDTVFSIASLTKAFAAAAAGTAVDKGIIDWDQPLIEHLPGFKLNDPYLTAATTYTDAFSHRTGVQEQSFYNGLDPRRIDVLEILSTAPSMKPFRTGYAYSNLLYTAAGFSAANAVGLSWPKHIRSAILEPLGMSRTTTSAHELATDENAAGSHLRGRDGIVRLDPFRPDGWWTMDNHAPAGAINSCANDMVRWLAMQLGESFLEGHRVLTPETLASTHQVHALTERGASEDRAVYGMQERGYGLGWSIDDDHGAELVQHDGLFRGHSSVAILQPNAGIGIFVFVNQREASRGLTSGIAHWILDRLLARSIENWPAVQHVRLLARADNIRSQETALLRRPREVRPAAPLESYCGAFAGSVPWERYIVTLDADALRLELVGTSEPYFASLEHSHGHTFLTHWNETVTDYEPSLHVTFTRNAADDTNSLLLERAGMQRADQLQLIQRLDGSPIDV